MSEKTTKILIVRFGAIGDVVHSSIIQQAIKAKHPEAEIHFMTSSVIAPILSKDVHLSKLYYFDMTKKNNLAYLLKLGLEVKRENYDYIINLQNSLRNQFLSLMSGAVYIPRHHTFGHSTDNFYLCAKSLYDDVEKPQKLKLYLDDERLNNIKDIVKDYPRPYFIFSPAGDNDKFRKGRIWPFENWNKLGKMLTQKYGGTVFVIGSKDEYQLHELNINIDNSVIFSGKFSLFDSIHLFSLADLFVSGDSGPLHMASALDVNTIGIYGSMPPNVCAPYGDKGHCINSEYPCRGCGSKTCKELKQDELYTPCMKEIEPEKVLNYIVENNLLNFETSNLS